MFSLAAAIDTFRSANRLLGRDFYGWTTVSADGDPVMASNGLPLKIDYAVADLPPVDILFVSVGLTTEFPGKSKVLAALRSWGRRGNALGALSVGSYLLAEAGQLDGYRCTIHWENRAGFMERFPDINCTGNVFEIDRKRYTCAGGTTSIDLMLEIVRGDFGSNLANGVANQFQHERIRSAGDRQRVGPERDLTGKSEKLRKHRRTDGRPSRRAAVGGAARQVGRAFRCARSSACSCATSTSRPAATTCGCGWSGRANCCARPTCRSSTWRSPPASPRIPISPRATGCSSAVRRPKSAAPPIELRSGRRMPVHARTLCPSSGA